MGVSSSYGWPFTINGVVVSQPAEWEAAKQAGKSPFKNSYDEWSEENIKYKGQGYTILPEYRISTRIKHFVDDNKGDFLADDFKLLFKDSILIS